jgi:hypothetical protein
VLACVPVAYSVWGGACFGLEHKLFTKAGVQCVRVLACVPVAYSVWGGACFGLEHKLFTARIQTPKHKPLPDHIGRLMSDSKAALPVEHMLPLAPGIGARF